MRDMKCMNLLFAVKAIAAVLTSNSIGFVRRFAVISGIGSGCGMSMQK